MRTLQEMLNGTDPTARELKAVSYGLVNGEFDAELQPRQQELQARLAEIETVGMAAMRQRVSISNLPPIEDDSYCDEYA